MQKMIAETARYQPMATYQPPSCVSALARAADALRLGLGSMIRVPAASAIVPV